MPTGFAYVWQGSRELAGVGPGGCIALGPAGPSCCGRAARLEELRRRVL